MPADEGVGLNEDQGFASVPPGLGEEDPEDTVPRTQLWASVRALQRRAITPCFASIVYCRPRDSAQYRRAPNYCGRLPARSEHRERIHQLAGTAGDHVRCDDQHEFPTFLVRRLR